MRQTDPVLTPRLPARMGKSADLIYKTASDKAMIALRIPTHVAQQIAIKGGERVADLHCTLVYLGDVAEINPDNLRSLCDEWLPAVGNVTPPLSGRIAGYGRFAPTEDEDVIWAGLDAPDLAELRHLVLQAVKNAGIVPVTDHGFTPHITLAYVESGEGEDSMPPNVEVDFRYLSVTVGDSEVMIPLKGEREIPAKQPVLSTETFSELQGPSEEFTKMLDLERWAQNKGSLMVRADTPGVGCVVVKKGTDVSIGIENWDGNVALGDLLDALGRIAHDFIMVGRLSAWDPATREWLEGDDLAAVYLAERVAVPTFFPADLFVFDGDLSKASARERFERLRVLVAPAGGAVIVPLQREVRADMELDAHIDEIVEWKPSEREDTWYCPGVTVVQAASQYTAEYFAPHEVRLVFKLRKDWSGSLVGIGAGGGVQEKPAEIIDDRIRQIHFPDIRPIAETKTKAYNENQPRDPGGEGGGQWVPTGASGADSDPAISEFLKKLDSDAKIKAARQAIAETVETIKVHKKDGQWTPERAALHEKIVNELLDDDASVPEGKTPTATFVIGLPASGKSGVLKPTIENLDKATTIDPDAVKEKLPEYNGKNAGAVHQESGEVAEGPLLMAALERRHNLVFDVVGKNKDKMLKLVSQLKQAGYDVDLRHVTLPPIEAAKRALTRFEEMGRFVDPKYILQDVGSKSDETYEALKNTGLVRSWESYDNSGPFGSKPTLRERGGSHVRLSRGADGRGYAGEVSPEDVWKDGVAGGTFGTVGTAGILAPQQGMFRKPKRSRSVNKGEIRTDLTLVKIGWTDEARAAALATRRRNAGLKVYPSTGARREWEIEHGDVRASLRAHPSWKGEGDEEVLYVESIYAGGEGKDDEFDDMGTRIATPVHPRETMAVLREIQDIARQNGFAHIEAQVVNDGLGKLLQRLPGVEFKPSLVATSTSPNRGAYRIPVPRVQEQIAASAFESLEIAKAWTDEARAAALDARRGKPGTVAGEDWSYTNPMHDMAEYDPTPDDDNPRRIRPTVWKPTPGLTDAQERRMPAWKWQDGDSFAVGYGVVGGHTFRCGTLKDGQFVPDKKQPRVNPYEAIFQRKGVLLGLGTLTKSTIDQAQADREQREIHEQMQAAIVGARVAMSELGIREGEQAAIIAKHYGRVAVEKIGWTDEARAKALETRRRNAALRGKPEAKPAYVDPDPPRTLGGPDEFKVRMRDASGETLIAPDGQVYSGAGHARMSASVGHSTDSSLAAGYVRGRVEDGILSVELDMENEKARANAKALVSAHGKDSNVYVDHNYTGPGSMLPTAVFVNPGAIGKAMRFIDSGGKDRSEVKPGSNVQPYDKSAITKEVVFDESKHPRDEDGKWTEGQQATMPPKTPDSLVQPSLPGMEGAGRTWEPENENDKVRQLFLEEERHTAIGLAQRDWDKLVGEKITIEGAGGWDALDDDDKSEYQNQWENDNVEEYINEAEKDWMNSSDASSAKMEKASESFYENVSESDVKEPVSDAIKGTFQGSQRQMEHFIENMDAMRLYQMGEAEDTREIEKHFDAIMGDQELEGDEQTATLDIPNFVTEIRNDYESRLDSIAEDIEIDIPEDAKEGINQNAYEAVSEAFHQLSSEDLDSLVGDSTSKETFTVEEPKQWLPEQPDVKTALRREGESDESYSARLVAVREERAQAEDNYEKTRQAAQALVQKRAESLWRERNPVPEGKEESDYTPDFHVLGDKFWNEWKRDSYAQGTHSMHNALVKELAANTLGREGDDEASGAERVYAKALWQTTQFVLHKAGMREVHAYRAIMVDGEKLKVDHPNPTAHTIGKEDLGGGETNDQGQVWDPEQERWVEPKAPITFSTFTDMPLKQGPAQSFTFDQSVANSWGGVGNRVPNPHRIVLRASLPPEAVWSLPVYGKNLQNENEVVVLGTPWKNWEAWDERAPDWNEIPMKQIQVTETPQIEKPKKTPDNG